MVCLNPWRSDAGLAVETDQMATQTPDAQSPLIMPYPRQIRLGPASVALRRLAITAEGAPARRAARRLMAGLREGGLPAMPEGYPLAIATDTALEARLGVEGYELRLEAAGGRLHAAGFPGLYYGTQTFQQLLRPQADGTFTLPLGDVCDWPLKPIRGVHVYLPARRDLPFFRRFIEWLGRHKLNTLFLEVGGGMAYHRHPEINVAWERFCKEAMAYPGGPNALQASQVFWKNSTHTELAGGRFLRQEELARIADWCADNAIEIIPEIQSLSHAYYLVMGHRELAEAADDPWPDTYCPSNPKSYELYFDVLSEVIGVLHPRVVSLGHDEAYLFGLCPKCRERDAAEIYATDITRTHDFLGARGIRTAMWGDKLLEIHHPNGTVYGGVERTSVRYGKTFRMPATRRCVDLVPRDVLVLDWYWSLSYDSAWMLVDKGFEVLYGNYYGPTFREWAKHRTNPGLLGGETSLWCAPEAYAIGRNGGFHTILWSANNLWSDVDPDGRRDEILQDVSAVLRRDRPRLTRVPSVLLGPAPTLQTAVDLTPGATRSLGAAPTAEFGLLPRGRQVLGGVEFFIPGGPESVGPVPAVDWHAASCPPIPVQRQADALAFLHTTTLDLVHGPTYYTLHLGRNVIGMYLVAYDDGSTVEVPLEYAVNIDAWNIAFMVGKSGDQSTTIAATVYQADPVVRGQRQDGKACTLFLYEWPNPHPQKPVRDVRLVWRAGYSKGFITLIAMTAVAKVATAP